MENDCDMAACSQLNDIQQIKRQTELNTGLLNKINDALLGNEFNKENGLIQQTLRNTQEIKKIKGRIIYWSGFSAGIGIFIGIIIGKIWK